MKNVCTEIPKAIALWVACTGCGLSVMAQGTLADYQRAGVIKSETPDKVYHHPRDITWSENNRYCWYRMQTAHGEVFQLVDVEKKNQALLFTPEKLMSALALQSGNPAQGNQLPLSGVRVFPEADSMEFVAFDQKWAYNLANEKLTSTGLEEKQSAPGGYWGRRANDRMGEAVRSPDQKWSAYIKNHNVYIRPTALSEQEIQLSFDGASGDYYSAHIFWSPDSENLAVNKIRQGQERTLYLIESSPKDQLQPKLHTRDYLKPGDALPQKQPVLFNIRSGRQTVVEKSRIDNQYSLSNPVWRSDGREFTFEYNQRGHQQYSIFAVDAAAGQAKEVIRENSPTFIDYSGKRFRYDVDDGREMIWMSERDGWNHLYLYDGRTGKLKNQITKGAWVVRKVLRVDEQRRTILFEASGRNPGQDPYFSHYYSVNFDGTNLIALTHEEGNHTAVFSPDYRYFIDSWSRVDQPATTLLRSAADGSILMELEKAEIYDLLKTGWQLPEVFAAKGRDGETDIWGIIIRPSNFDPEKKYPIVEYIYAGPHSAFVPKSFVTDSRGDLHQLAELGFIVVQIDGMGTSNRSKAFHNVCFQNLKDGGFPDRIAWMKAAAAKYPYMDLERVGIFGNSAGGQNSAGAVLLYPEFYKVAVSSSGCHDNRMDKIWWNEQWMGYPVGPHYAASSNVTHAHRLEGKLLLILGELDDNVDPSSTLQFVDALITANKNFDFLFIPGMGHSMGGEYGERRRRDFFVKHLLGVEPPEWRALARED